MIARLLIRWAALLILTALAAVGAATYGQWWVILPLAAFGVLRADLSLTDTERAHR